MKKNIFIVILCFLKYSLAFSQYENVLMQPDSTLNLYLSNILNAKSFTNDTCFSGVYNISFSLSPSGDIKNFTTSKMLPQRYADTIQNLLDNLKNKWDKNFLKWVSWNKKTIIQPLYLFIYYDCKNASPRLKFKNSSKRDSLINIEELNDFFELGNIIANIEKTFLKSNDFKNQAKNKIQECLLLEPCVVVKKSIRRNIKM